MANFFFIKSERGSENLVFEEYIYYLKKKTDLISYWRCKHYKKCLTSCAARVVIRNKLEITRNGEHNHSSDRGFLQNRQFYERLEKRAETEISTAIPALYSEELAATSAIAANLPSYDTVKKRLYEARQRNFPKLPKTLDESVLSEEWQYIADGTMSANEKPSQDPSNPDYVPSVFDASVKNTKKGKRKKKEKILAIPEEGPTSETAQAWSSVLNLQPIESVAGGSGVNVSHKLQHDTTEPTSSKPEELSTVSADSGVLKPKEKRKSKLIGQRKVPRSPSPTANAPVESHTDPLKLCVVKMEIEDDGYNEDENYLTSLASSSSQQSQENAFGNLPSIKTEPNQEMVPTVFKTVPTVNTSSSNKQTVEAFFKNVAETVMQLPPHLIEVTKAKVSSLVYDMVIQAISEGCTNIQQPEL